MTKMLTTTRSLLLAGTLAFAALPVLAQTAPSQPAAPSAGSTVAPDSTPTAKSTTGTSKPHLHSKKITAAHSKSKIHTVSAKKSVSSTTHKAATGTGTVDTSNTKKP